MINIHTFVIYPSFKLAIDWYRMALTFKHETIHLVSNVQLVKHLYCKLNNN